MRLGIAGGEWLPSVRFISAKGLPAGDASEVCNNKPVRNEEPPRYLGSERRVREHFDAASFCAIGGR